MILLDYCSDPSLENDLESILFVKNNSFVGIF